MSQLDGPIRFGREGAAIQMTEVKDRGFMYTFTEDMTLEILFEDLDQKTKDEAISKICEKEMIPTGILKDSHYFINHYKAPQDDGLPFRQTRIVS